jgi:hypothetical protein
LPLKALINSLLMKLFMDSIVQPFWGDVI